MRRPFETLRRHLLLLWLIAGGMVAASCTARAEVQASAQRPNVLFIAVDDLNDWVGVLGGHPQARTPNIDRLAERGVLFTSAYTNAPLCTPSRASIFTGRQPFTLDFYTHRARNQAWPRTLHVTLPEHFRANGYRAMGAGKLFHGNGNVYPEAFDDFGPGTDFSGGPFTRDEMDGAKQDPTHLVNRGGGGLRAVLPLNRMADDRKAAGQNWANTFDWGPVDVADDEMADGKIAKWAVQRLQEEYERPFFLAVGFFRPHQPLFAPRKYFEPFPVEDVILPASPPDDLSDVPPAGVKLAREIFTGGYHATVLEHDQWRAAVAGYLASVYFVDAQIGRVLDALDASPHADDTIIVLWSDHGYHTGEKEHWGKFTGWSPSTRIPMIVVPARNQRVSGFRAGTRADAPVSLVDLYPTLVQMSGLPSLAGLDGRSLVPLLAKPELDWNEPAISTFGRGNHMLRDRRWYYIHYFDGTEELYDAIRDPRQWNNLAGSPEHAGVLREMRSRLPAYPHVRHFVRMGDWKAVIYHGARPPELFHMGPLTIAERDDLSAEHPEVLAQILERLRNRKPTRKFLSLEADDHAARVRGSSSAMPGHESPRSGAPPVQTAETLGS